MQVPFLVLTKRDLEGVNHAHLLRALWSQFRIQFQIKAMSVCFQITADSDTKYNGSPIKDIPIGHDLIGHVQNFTQGFLAGYKKATEPGEQSVV